MGNPSLMLALDYVILLAELEPDKMPRPWRLSAEASVGRPTPLPGRRRC